MSTADIKQILPEQVKLLFGQLKLGVAASLINAAILCLLLWGEVQPIELAIWYALVFAVNVPRYQLGRSYLRAVNSLPPERWAKWLIASNIASGAIWGCRRLFPVSRR